MTHGEISRRFAAGELTPQEAAEASIASRGPDVTPWPIRVVLGLLVLVVVVGPFLVLGWKLWHARSGIR